MFNRQPYNLGKFNISSLESMSGSGIGSISLSAPVVKPSMVISTPQTAGNIKIGQVSDGTKNIFSLQTAGNVELGSSGNAMVRKYGDATSTIEIGSNATSIVAGESVIRLQGINLKAGGELVINTCDMTVTVNGQNAMQYFTVDSDFFSLLQGSNDVIYSDNATSRNVFLDLIWKDRWI